MSWHYAAAAVVIALLAWDAFRRYLLARGGDSAAQIDALRTELSDHKGVHEAAVKNLAEQVKQQIDEMRTRVSVAENRGTPPVARMRFGR